MKSCEKVLRTLRASGIPESAAYYFSVRTWSVCGSRRRRLGDVCDDNDVACCR
jgi:hypothetical protein